MGKPCGCGEKDVAAIAAASAQMQRNQQGGNNTMLDKLMKRLDGKPEAPEGPPEGDPERQMVPQIIARLTDEKARLVGEQISLAREAEARAKALIVMAQPNVPEGMGKLHFDLKEMAFYVLMPVEQAPDIQPEETDEAPDAD